MSGAARPRGRQQTASEGRRLGRQMAAAGRVGRRAVLLGILLAGFVDAPAEGGELRIILANDYLTNNAIDDDLYSYSFTFEYHLGERVLRLSEAAFTDSNNNLRFDETSLVIGQRLDSLRGWHLGVEVGLLRVGEGLLGESAQNAVHRLVGDEELHLPYIEDSHLYPVVSLRLDREAELKEGLWLQPKGGLRCSFGYGRTAWVGGELLWQVLSRFWLGFELGGRYDHSSFAPLEPWLAKTGLMGALSMRLPKGLVLKWTYNEFGTRLQHVSLGYRFTAGGRPRFPVREVLERRSG